MFRLLVMLSLLLSFFSPVFAADGDSPVGVISLVWGEVTVKHENEDYKPARWLEPIFAGDLVKTATPGSKLLVTFFDDNHQEVMGPASSARVDDRGLTKIDGEDIRKDPARNPFGAGGVGNPFIYTRKLAQADFANAASADLETEKLILAGRVRPSFPPSMFWSKQAEGTVSHLRVFDYLGKPMWTREVQGHTYKLTEKEADAMPKGVVYTWDVVADKQTVVVRYPFRLLTKPQRDWYQKQRRDFDNKKAAGKLERSDWTDMILVSTQLYYVDEAIDLLYKMRDMDPQNPNIYRALTRAYLHKGCPGTAQQALDKELQLGGIDPINL